MSGVGFRTTRPLRAVFGVGCRVSAKFSGGGNLRITAGSGSPGGARPLRRVGAVVGSVGGRRGPSAAAAASARHSVDNRRPALARPTPPPRPERSRGAAALSRSLPAWCDARLGGPDCGRCGVGGAVWCSVTVRGAVGEARRSAEGSPGTGRNMRAMCVVALLAVMFGWSWVVRGELGASGGPVLIAGLPCAG